MATSIIMLERMKKVKPVLQAMVKTKQYKDWAAKPAYVSKSKKFVKLISSEQFWMRLTELTTICNPIVTLLRLADSGQPSIGKIHNSVTKLREHFETVILSPPSRAAEKRRRLIASLDNPLYDKLLNSPLFHAGKWWSAMIICTKCSELSSNPIIKCSELSSNLTMAYVSQLMSLLGLTSLSFCSAREFYKPPSQFPCSVKFTFTENLIWEPGTFFENNSVFVLHNPCWHCRAQVAARLQNGICA